MAEAIIRVRHAGATGALTLRADSGFYAAAVVSACRRHDVHYSITARKNPAIQRAIDAIPEDDWVAIPVLAGQRRRRRRDHLHRVRRHQA